MYRPRNQGIDLPLNLEHQNLREKPTLEIKGDNKTIVDWMSGHTKMKTRIGTVERAQDLLRE